MDNLRPRQQRILFIRANADLAISILARISSSGLTVSFSQAPKYLKWVTLSISSPRTVIRAGFTKILLTTMNLVLEMLMVNPYLEQASSTASTRFWRSSMLSARSAVSSAYRILLMHSPPIRTPSVRSCKASLKTISSLHIPFRHPFTYTQNFRNITKFPSPHLTFPFPYNGCFFRYHWNIAKKVKIKCERS